MNNLKHVSQSKSTRVSLGCILGWTAWNGHFLSVKSGHITGWKYMQVSNLILNKLFSKVISPTCIDAAALNVPFVPHPCQHLKLKHINFGQSGGWIMIFLRIVIMTNEVEHFSFVY